MSRRGPISGSAVVSSEENLIKAESNLEEYPFFAIKLRNRKTEPQVFERIVEGQNGTSLHQTWTVMPSTGYGMPGPLDQDVYLAVLELLEQKGGMPANGRLYFSLYELVNLLGWSESGKNGGKIYREIKECLERIGATRIKSENAFYSKERDSYISDSFNIWSVHLVGDKPREGERRERHSLEFHRIFIRNFHAQYLKGLDADFYWSLSSPLSKRLYRLVDQQRRGKLTFGEDLFKLREQIPLANYSYASKIKEALGRAHEELIKRGFLSDVCYEGKMIRYHISDEFVRRQKALELSGDPEEIFAIRRLMSEGLRGDIARDLVARYGSERCLYYADALGTQKGIRNPAGWLRRAIENGYEVSLAASTESHLSAASPKPPSADKQEGEGENKKASLIADRDAEEVWKILLKELSQEIDSPSFHVWFEGVVPTSFEDSTLTLEVPNAVAKQYIEERFGEIMRRVLSEQRGADAEVEIKCWQDNGG